jgi:hypothetical protein
MGENARNGHGKRNGKEQIPYSTAVKLLVPHCTVLYCDTGRKIKRCPPFGPSK